MVFELSELAKTKNHPITYQAKFHNNTEHHPNYLYIFIDGSKDNDKTACRSILNKKIIRKALVKERSIFSAEAYAKT